MKPMISGFFSRSSLKTVVTVTEQGEVGAVYRLDGDAKWCRAQEREMDRKVGSCWLALPPGHCSMRSMHLPGADRKETAGALQCYAESSLLHNMEDGCVELVVASPKQQDAPSVLFWCELTFLERATFAVEAMGGTIAGFLVPEHRLGSGGPGLLVHEDVVGSAPTLFACYSAPDVPPIVQTAVSSSIGARTLMAGVLAAVRRTGAPLPERVFVWRNEGTDSLLDEDALRVDGLECVQHIEIHGWTELLPFLTSGGQSWPGRKRSQSPFQELLTSQNRLPLERSAFVRLLGTVFLAVTMVAAFVLVLFVQLEDDVARLKKEASRITRASRNAAQATQRIRALQQQNQTIRRFAEQKPYSLALLKAITEATSRGSRLETVSISRDGQIMLTGFSKDASHVAAIMKKLEEAPDISQCVLVSLEHNVENDLHRFSIQGVSEEWAAFFKEDGTP